MPFREKNGDGVGGKGCREFMPDTTGHGDDRGGIRSHVSKGGGDFREKSFARACGDEATPGMSVELRVQGVCPGELLGETGAECGENLLGHGGQLLRGEFERIGAGHSGQAGEGMASGARLAISGVMIEFIF